MAIDITFDMRSDAGGRDPDSHSATLRRCHQRLWSRPLPDGTPITVEPAPGSYLHMTSPQGRWTVGSDSIIHTYATWRQTAAVIADIPPVEIDDFLRDACTVGGYIVFPVALELKPTLNQARGTRAAISDRFDLTLECIRRHYRCETSPLSDVLDSYAAFFGIFTDFPTYVSFGGVMRASLRSTRPRLNAAKAVRDDHSRPRDDGRGNDMLVVRIRKPDLGREAETRAQRTIAETERFEPGLQVGARSR